MLLLDVGGETRKILAELSDIDQGPNTERQNNNLHKLLNGNHNENDDAPDVLRNTRCQYFELDEMHSQVDSKSFSIFSLNIRSLSGHFESLKDTLYSMLPATFSVIALQEIWSIHKTYELTGYNNIIFKTRDMKKERNPNCGGGVGFFVSSKFNFEILDEESIFVEGVYESLWIKVEVAKNTFKIIGNVYRPNTAPKANIKKAIEIHSSILSKINKSKVHSKCSIEIVGDFNLDLLQFQRHDQTNDFLETSFSFGLLPVITKPTRVTPTSATLIDHIWVKNEAELHRAGIILCHISDHYPTFYIHQAQKEKQPPKPFKTRLINKDSQNSFRKLLKNANYDNVLSDENPETAYLNFFSIYNTAAEVAFPEITLRPKKHTFAHSPWMTPGLLVSCKTRHKLLRAKEKNPSSQNIAKFRAFNRVFTACRRKAQALYYTEKFSQCRTNLKETWNLIREVSCTKAKQRDKIPDFFQHNGNTLRDPNEIANIFNKYFTDIGPKLAGEIPSSTKPFSNFLGLRNENDFKFSELSEFRLYNFIQKIKPKTSFGQDLVSSKVLQFVAPTILKPLKHLINLSLRTGHFPQQFKVAKIVPIYKDSDKHEFNNYRPISLLSSLSRLLESIVSFQLTAFAEAHNIFYKHQYGFRTKHSVVHPLLHFTENILKALNEGMINISIFVDLRKAFDTVNYEILLAKLEHYGVRNNELLWFRNYLTKRTQYTNLNIKGESFNSCLLECKCGVPQGSCLGPLLFLFFINDLPNATKFFSLLFADDTTFQITGRNSIDTFLRANIELEKAEQWFCANKLTLNSKKTRVMIFKGKRQHVHYYNLYLQNNIIERVGDHCKENLVRFLGIWIDENLSFTGHLAKLKSKLNTGIYALATCTKVVPFRVRKLIYHSLFESYLHFGSIIYGAATSKNLEQIAIVQRKAVRVLTRSKYNAHADPLFKKHQLLKVGDLIHLNQSIFVRQFKNAKLPESFHNFFQRIPLSSQRSRDDDYNLQKQTNIDFYHFPSNQIVKSWNQNHLIIKSEADISALKEKFIKQKLDSYDEECLKENCMICRDKK